MTGVGVGVRVGVEVGVGVRVGVEVGVVVGVGNRVGVGVGELVGVGVGIGSDMVEPVAVMPIRVVSMLTIVDPDPDTVTCVVGMTAGNTAVNGSVAICMVPCGGVVRLAGSSPKTRTIFPVVLASAYGVCLMIRVKSVFVSIISDDSFNTAGVKAISTCINPVGALVVVHSCNAVSGVADACAGCMAIWAVLALALVSYAPNHSGFCE